MILKPPDGSKISVTTEGTDPVIVVPHGSASAIRYFVGLFLLFWLGGWFVGFSSTISTLAFGKFHPFLVFWLGGSTLAGIAMVVCLYRIFRPSISGSLRLMLQGVRYDSGIPPFQMNPVNQMNSWKTLFPKRTRVDIDRQKLKSLRLRETEAGNRLTVDAGAARLDIAQSASEIEREWLYQVLAKRYSLAAGEAAGPAPGRSSEA